MPSINSIKIYLVSAALSGAGEYPHTLGIGSSEERRKAIVATSLATAAKDLEIVTLHGHAPPFGSHGDKEGTGKPTLGKLFQVDNVVRTPIDGPSTLKTRLRSAWRKTSLMLNMLEYGLDIFFI